MITFVNQFAVPEGRDEEFLDLWTQVNAYLAPKAGYVDHALHRSLDPGASHRYVNLAHWDSVDDWRAAHDEGFRGLVQQPQWRDFPSQPAVYDATPVHAGPA